MPDNRLAELVLNNGGKTLEEAVADARACMNSVKDVAFEGIEAAIASLEALVADAQESNLSHPQMQDILSYADRLMMLSGAFDLTGLTQVVQSLVGLSLGLVATGEYVVEPVAVHVHAARLFAPSSSPVAEEESKRLFAELKRLVSQFLRIAPRPADEERRQSVLDGLIVHDRAPEEQFQRLTSLVAEHFKVPIALISLVDRDRQWFLSKTGLNVDETDRDASFCAHAIMQDEPLVILDAVKDSRFAGNPLVLDEPNLRFYAGAPLTTAEGVKLGTLCIIDTRPRETFGADECATLQELAKRVMDMIYARVFRWLSDQDSSGQGGPGLKEEDIDLSDLLRACASPYELRAALKNVDFRNVEIDPGLPALRADRAQTEQMIVQLLSQAFRKAERGGQLRLRAFKSPATGIEIEASVRGATAGPGDPSGIQVAGNAEQDALSPNLNIAKRLIEMHGGTLSTNHASDADIAMRLSFPAYRAVAQTASSALNGKVNGPAS